MGVTTNSRKKDKLRELEQMKMSLEVQLLEMSKTVEKQKEQIAMAGKDTLTGLRNRTGVTEQVNSYLKKDIQGTFFIMDMDNFKSVNDTYGHVEGDKVLERFAQALEIISDENDIVARIGGDEFIIFSPGYMSKEMIRNKAIRIVRFVERRIATSHRFVRTTVSMGIAVAPINGISFEELYENGDKALYSVKSEGKNSFKFYDDMNANRKAKEWHKDTLVDITSKIKEKKLDGSLMIEFDGFEKIYRFLERIIPRENREVQSVLLTIDSDCENDDINFDNHLHDLEKAIVTTLRRGDVGTVYSKSQIMILLMDTNTENAHMVVNRILTEFNTLSEETINIIYEIQQLIPEEEYD